jgi:DnaJ-class molecular chaperone
LINPKEETVRNISKLLIVFIAFSVTTYAQNKFIGAKSCGMCHKKADQGEQLKIWQESAHANAFKTLQSEDADKIAAEAGSKTKAAETEACLVCHATGYNVDASLLGKKFKVDDGVQCETCHGAGSKYKSKKVMKDHAKSVAAGMTEYADDAAIEAQCVTCHNEKSPTFKAFDFKTQWDKIKHPVPAKG